MSNLQIFNYGDSPVRTVTKDREPWWVLKDVCDVLELTDTNKTAERLDTDELTRIKLVSGGQAREMYAVNEAGLYNVIIRSDKPEAKAFKRWITHEVLPAIRKTGSYVAAATSPKPRLGEINSAARFLDKSLRDAGVPPEFRIMTVKGLYETVGVKVITQGVSAPPVMLEPTEIAKRLGVRSRSGSPHAQVVSAVIEKVGYGENERTLVPYHRNGHSGASPQYAESVLARVGNWFRENNYPAEIPYNGRNLSVYY